MTEPLAYAPTPPRDRGWLVRQGPDVTLSLAPRPTWHTALHLLIHGSIALFLAALAVCPTGKFAVAGVLVESEVDGGLGRLVCAVIAALMLAGIFGTFQHFRGWTVIELHRGLLICTSPGIYRPSRSVYTLSEFRDAVIGRGEDGDVHVGLVPRDDRATPRTLLGGPTGVLYRRSDLEYVARLIRGSIADAGAVDTESSLPGECGGARRRN